MYFATIFFSNGDIFSLSRHHQSCCSRAWLLVQPSIIQLIPFDDCPSFLIFQCRHWNGLKWAAVAVDVGHHYRSTTLFWSTYHIAIELATAPVLIMTLWHIFFNTGRPNCSHPRAVDAPCGGWFRFPFFSLDFLFFSNIKPSRQSDCHHKKTLNRLFRLSHLSTRPSNKSGSL